MILAGTDFSRGAEAAVRVACAWAASPAGRPGTLVVTHVLEGAARTQDPVLREGVARELEALAQRASRHAGGPVPEAMLDDGDALDRLAPAPDRLVVVGTEGGSAMLLRRAGHVPTTLATGLAPGARLLAVPPGWKPRGGPRSREGSRRRPDALALGRVLVACGLDGRDARLLEAACDLARAAERVEIHIVHVLDASALRHEPPGLRARARGPLDENARRAEERLRDLAADALPVEWAAQGAVRVHVVRQGPVERDLGGLAASQAADIVVASRGAVAARLVGFTPCPLLVVG